ncbi:hypothetical protein BBF93_06675 [Hyphomonas sp. CACIAM 19H1]|uniref:tetratricopeptide repeat protein n=1 Tax=Hyphomonas sp. CACIAM 19H1 TaxID=1873716 RepID=UPI000DEE05CF|nr:tetratricopeptide repeat protein [Hyphomonas sp. CACIAM 19H1]AXE63935.1 hypothetical protein BBF93_06675 [Hyphomonas sp. CACIAM 19H1]
MTQDISGSQAHQRHLRRSLTWLRNGRADLALPVLRRLETAHPGDPAIKLTLAAALLRTGDTEPALAAFESVLQAHPAHTSALHGRGLCLHAAGDTPGALDAFRRAVASDPHAWRAWRSIADITPYEDERVHAIEGAADAVRLTCQAEEVPPARLADLATALIEARTPATAVQILAGHPAAQQSDPALLRARARSLYHAGDHAAALTEAARLYRHFTATPHPDASFSPFIPDRATDVLIEIRSLLANAGVESFLIAGTLLGFHRNGGPLPHDRDIDIGVFRTPDGGPDIAGILRTAPGILLPRIARPGDRYFGLMHRGIGVDIFVHDRSGPHLLTGFTHMPGDIQWRFNAFDLRSARYGGQDWTIPSDPGRYLAESYGPGWQSPDTGFASAVSSPALHATSPHVRGYYAVMRAVRALATADTAKAAALIAASPVPLPSDDTQPTD